MYKGYSITELKEIINIHTDNVKHYRLQIEVCEQLKEEANSELLERTLKETNPCIDDLTDLKL